MTVLWGDTGKIAQGTLKQTDFTLPTPRETTSVGLTLPTTEPGTPQIAYTVQASDLATYSNGSVQHVPAIYACGKIGAAITTLNYRVLVNDVSQVTASNASIAANNYYTYSFFKYIPLAVGDTVKISLWSSQADTTLVYHAFTTFWTRPQSTKAGTILKDVGFGACTAFPVLSLSPTPVQVISTQNFLVFPSSNPSVTAQVQPAATTFFALVSDANLGLGKCNYGDFLNVQFNSHATNQFQYYKNNVPASISFREILR